MIGYRGIELAPWEEGNGQLGRLDDLLQHQEDAEPRDPVPVHQLQVHLAEGVDAAADSPYGVRRQSLADGGTPII